MFGNSDLKKTDLYAILVGIFCASLIVSNIIASKTFELYWVSLPCAVIIFPILLMMYLQSVTVIRKPEWLFI